MQAKVLKSISVLMMIAVLLPFSPVMGNPDPPPEITVLESGITITGSSAQTSIDLDAALMAPDGRVSLIVELADAPLGLTDLVRDPEFEAQSPASQAALATLAEQQDQVLSVLQRQAPSAALTHRYGAAFNGFSLLVDPAEADSLLKLDGVKWVYPDRMRGILLDSSTEVINAPAFWTDLGGQSKAGNGVRVAVIDTGIRSENPLFDGAEFTGPPGFPRGYCTVEPDDPDFQCNDKLIAARYYTPTFSIHPDEVLSPLDIHGHGSHVAGIAAGNPVEVPTGAVVPEPTTISGVAPRAYLMAYKAIFLKPDGNIGGSDAMFLAAMNDALLDGADVINNSWGGEDGGDPAESPYASAVQALNAAGIVVVFAAGNGGPGGGTISCPACLEEVITVGASTTDRMFANTLDAVGPGAIPGSLTGLGALSGTGPSITGTIETGILYSDSVDPGNADGCASFAAGTFSGMIALIPRGGCPFSLKVDNAEAAGAAAVAIYNYEPGFPILMGGLEGSGIPAVFLSQDQGEALRDWVISKVSPTARINAARTAVRNSAWKDTLWESSAVGPNGDPDVLKPELLAPGVNILSAAASGEGFQFLQGTSMAAPHVTGAAALLIHKHSQWSPAQVKSALTSTANRQVKQPDGLSAADPFQMGAGRVDLNKARNAGVTFSQSSFANGLCSTQCMWQAEIKNEALEYGAWWDAQISAPAGMKVQVEPSTVVLGLGESRTFTVTADVSAVGIDQWHFVDIGWQHKNTAYPEAHLPLAVYVVEPDQARLEKTADRVMALPGDSAYYTITLTNDAPITTTFLLRDPIPAGASYVPDSATGGLFYDAGENELVGTVELDRGVMRIEPGTLHGQYLPMSNYVAAEPCPGGNCDDAALLLSGFDFNFYGQQVTDLVWSTNGFLRVGSELQGLNNEHQLLPDPAAPNNLIAPLWADLELDSCTSGGSTMGWYRAFVTDGTWDYYVFEWTEAALKSDPAACFSFQVWIKTSSDEIWFVYGPQSEAVTSGTVGVENPYGSAGYTAFYDGVGSAPLEGTTLKAVTEVDQAVFTYALNLNADIGDDIINTVEATNARSGRVEQATAVVQVGKRVYLPFSIR